MTTTQPLFGRLRALCNECGEVRHVTSRAGYGKSGDNCSSRFRCILWAKCANCGCQTLHSYLRDFDPDADEYESDDTEGPRRALAGALEPEAVLKANGLRSVYVQGLGRDAWLVAEASIVLIEAGLSPDRMAAVVAQVLELPRGTKS